jgi:hypothetical protein
MLDRTDHTQSHYYQPGIGTYVAGHTLSHTSSFARFKSWYMKAKDSAIGTSFDQHVIGGYKVCDVDPRLPHSPCQLASQQVTDLGIVPDEILSSK